MSQSTVTSVTAAAPIVPPPFDKVHVCTIGDDGVVWIDTPYVAPLATAVCSVTGPFCVSVRTSPARSSRTIDSPTVSPASVPPTEYVFVQVTTTPVTFAPATVPMAPAETAQVWGTGPVTLVTVTE